ncbi:MAG: NADH-quinone oxidoreductase subunit A [Chloroflexi bacterium]|nr:NADH-quinone oxidoreductase subunit A [Chloroflexota bacterium]
MEDYFRQYGLVAIFSVIALALPLTMLILSWLARYVRIRPYKPNPTKYSTYECGMEAVGGRWLRFHVGYYTFALLFVVFDVLAVFIYPWAIGLGGLGLVALGQMLVFIAILLVGWLYAWRKGALEWK